VAYNLPRPAAYEQHEFDLLSRFEEMYSRSLSHSKKHFYLVERDESETYVVYRKTSTSSSYTLLL